MSRSNKALKATAALASLIIALGGGSATWAQTDAVRGEDRDLQHEQMSGSETGTTAPDTERGEVEMSHEEMQATDHEGHIEAPATGRTQAEQ